MKEFIGTKIVKAAPALRLDDGKGNVRVELLSSNPLPQPGDAVDMGYKVVYPDGYESWSPQDVFEHSYRPTNGMNFGLAIEALKMEFAVARKGWNGKGIYLELQVPDEHSKMTLPYIYIVTDSLVTDNPHAPKGRVPWLASQTDMLADDWYIVECANDALNQKTVLPSAYLAAPRTEYRYNIHDTGQRITVKRCQCRDCGKIAYIHFEGKTAL